MFAFVHLSMCVAAFNFGSGAFSMPSASRRADQARQPLPVPYPRNSLEIKNPVRSNH